MTFRNLTLFRFPGSITFDALESRLAALALKPVGPMELSSRGFVPPMGGVGDDGDSAFVHQVGSAMWVTLGGEDRLLPGAVVNSELQKKVAAFEEKNARRPGGKLRRQMKEELVAELMPRAFVRPVRTDALIDLDHRVVAIDTSSRKSAEAVVSGLREALGSFPALPVAAQVAPRSVLTGWVAGEPLPDSLALGDECEFRDPADSGAVVKLQRMELAGEEIETHLAAGRQVARLAVLLGERVGCVLGEDLVLRKLRLLEAAVESTEATERDDLRAELDARFALFAGEFHQLFSVLEDALKLAPAG